MHAEVKRSRHWSATDRKRYADELGVVLLHLENYNWISKDTYVSATGLFNRKLRVPDAHQRASQLNACEHNSSLMEAGRAANSRFGLYHLTGDASTNVSSNTPLFLRVDNPRKHMGLF